MAVEFREYKGKRKPINPQHKFPLLRLLLVALAAVAVYFSGLPSKIADALPLPGNEPEEIEDTWETHCSMAGGSPRVLSDSLVQCTWNVNEVNQDSLLLPDPFLRYLASLRKTSYMEISWMAHVRDFSNPLMVFSRDEYRNEYLHMRRPDSSFVWIRRAVESASDAAASFSARDDGCRFPGICPHVPLEWSALPITDGFDFEGQESLIAADVFRGLGEAPVYAILPGHILDIGKDSLGYFAEISHGNNISSRTSGMGMRNESLSVGDSVQVDVPIGKLAPLDSSVFYLSVRENGRFVRWKNFYEDAYPVSRKEIDAFLDNVARLLDSRMSLP